MNDDQTLGSPEAIAALGAQEAARLAEHHAKYTAYAVVESRGAGLLGLLWCRRCGSVLMLDEKADVYKIHDDWHAKIDKIADHGFDWRFLSDRP